jgi:hypothetical protein
MRLAQHTQFAPPSTEYCDDINWRRDFFYNRKRRQIIRRYIGEFPPVHPQIRFDVMLYFGCPVYRHGFQYGDIACLYFCALDVNFGCCDALITYPHKKSRYGCPEQRLY